jgi:hypothetical protein
MYRAPEALIAVAEGSKALISVTEGSHNQSAAFRMVDVICLTL